MFPLQERSKTKNLLSAIVKVIEGRRENSTRSERARGSGRVWEAEKIRGQDYKLAQMLVLLQCLAWLSGLRGGRQRVGQQLHKHSHLQHLEQLN